MNEVNRIDSFFFLINFAFFTNNTFALLTAESYPSSIEILTPVIDISDEDNDDDFHETDDHCRYSVTRREGLFFFLCLHEFACFPFLTKKTNKHVFFVRLNLNISLID
jgi:hypothetical protein